MPNNSLINIVRTELQNRTNNELETANTIDTGLNYQFMYKQLESAVEEIIIKYPNDDIVNELKQNLIRNLKPILDMMSGQDFTNN